MTILKLTQVLWSWKVVKVKKPPHSFEFQRTPFPIQLRKSYRYHHHLLFCLINQLNCLFSWITIRTKCPLTKIWLSLSPFRALNFGLFSSPANTELMRTGYPHEKHFLISQIMSFFHPTSPHLTSVSFNKKENCFCQILRCRSYDHSFFPIAIIPFPSSCNNHFEQNHFLLNLNLFFIWHLINVQGLLENFRSVPYSSTGFFQTPGSTPKCSSRLVFPKIAHTFLQSDLYVANLSQ